MIHDKTGILHLAQLMRLRNIQHVVISPGSRNAPLVRVFASDDYFKCYSIVDERSAAFFALGMAQQLEEPVALVCTSGTAALNYAPAVAEAFYQRIPLVLLTADRPAEWIDQGDGQTIHQQQLYGPHVRKSVNLPNAIRNENDLWHNDRLICEALNAATRAVGAPVHINIPLAEPLYGFAEEMDGKLHDISEMEVMRSLSETHQTMLLQQWQQAAKKMILVGQMHPSTAVEDSLRVLAQRPDVVVLSETTSNVFDAKFIACIDRSLAVMKEPASYYPDLLITIGGPVVSKRIKGFLRKAAPVHWNIDLADAQMDTYQTLLHAIPLKPEAFLPLMMNWPASDSNYASQWNNLRQEAARRHLDFMQHAVWSDLKIFELLTTMLPGHWDVQLGNSTPVRYAQLFHGGWAARFDCNRGTSGIDGSLSTAAGAAAVSGRPTLLISGDLSFFYDSNGLWNRHLPDNLKLVVVNNGGGGIFRFIEGPAQTGLLEDFFEARHQTSACKLAAAYGLTCFEAENEARLREVWRSFLEQDKAALLEIHSPAEASGQTIIAYFDYLKSVQ